MWFYPTTQAVAHTHADVRNIVNIMGPRELTDDIIADLGFVPLKQMAPDYDPLRQQATELAPIEVDGAWTQAWEITDLPEDQVAANLAAHQEQQRAAIDAYLGEVRSMRERLLNRLAGIGAAAIVSGDTDTQQAFVQARDRLLDITTIPDALEARQAGDLAALEAAVKTEYAAIVADAPPSLTKAFDEVDE